MVYDVLKKEKRREPVKINSFINRILLFSICLASAFYIKLDAVFILCAFAALTITCINFYTDRQKVRIITTTLYQPLIFLFPVFTFFQPLLSYDFFLVRNFFPLTAAAVNVILLFQKHLYVHLVFTVLGSILSVMLCRQNEAYDRLNYKYMKTRDDGTELTMLLEEKNRSILENQNREIYTATLKERNRIAREIHDNVGHLLSRSILMTGALKATNQDKDLAPQLNMLDETLNSAMDTIRASVHNLHEDSLNLREALNSLRQSFDFCPIQMDYDIEHDPRPEIKYCLISILKEGLSNIIKHSNATLVRVVIREHPSMYQFIIHDNGKVSNPSNHPGIGITNMKDRVTILKGNIAFGRKNGFRIFITIPKGEQQI